MNLELRQISKVTDNIYLSGVPPLDANYSLIKQLGITCILSCVDKKYVSDIHLKIMQDNPDIIILYLPYNDDTKQNLWQSNKNVIDVNKQMPKLTNRYQNKPMIDIGYHFMNLCISSKHKILVHCMAGISRSVSLIVYYLMKKHNMPFDIAYNRVLQSRSIANPNDSFKAQLLAYECKRDKLTEEDADRIIKNLKK